MITYSIPEKLDIPVYQYLYNCLREDIEKGVLKPHEKLPSKRTLAKQLQLSLITIENAYSQLMIEGYITAVERKGYYVNQIEMVVNKQPELMETKEKQPSAEYEVDLTASSSNVEYFPFASWSKIVRKVLAERRAEILEPSDYRGLEQLRKAIAEHLHQYMGLDVSQDQIVVGAGSEYLYSQLVQLFGRSVKYALEDPGHQTIAKVYQSNQVEYCFIPLDKQGIDADLLQRSGADIVHISPNHHYPTGITMPISRRQQLLKWAKENDGYIIEDDYDSQFRLKGKPIAPLFSLDNNNCVVYMNTFSVSLASSFRLAYMVLPWPLMQRYQQKMSFYHCPVANLEQLVLSEFISSGSFERHINRMRKRYRDIRNQLISQIKQSAILNSLTIEEADSGLHLLLVYPYEISDEAIEQAALSLSFHIYTLSHFSSTPNDSHTLIIRYTALDEKMIESVIDKLEQLFTLVKESSKGQI